jgi:hypothetical protein
VVGAYARIDVLVNVAGVVLVKPLVETRWEDFHAHVAKRIDPAKLSARARRDAALKIEVRRVFEENF